jgi:hypothetical protein
MGVKFVKCILILGFSFTAQSFFPAAQVLVFYHFLSQACPTPREWKAEIQIPDFVIPLTFAQSSSCICTVSQDLRFACVRRCDLGGSHYLERNMTFALCAAKDVPAIVFGQGNRVSSTKDCACG